MKYIFTTYFIFLSILFTHSQSIIFPSLNTAIKFEESKTADIEYEKWYLRNASDYVMLFKQNTIGVKKAIELTRDICIYNNLEFSSPNSDNSYLASYIKSITDYEALNTSVGVGGSIVEMRWIKSKYDESTKNYINYVLELNLDEKKNSIKIFQYSSSKSIEKISSQNVKELTKADIYKLAFDEFKKSNFQKSDSLFTIYKNKYPTELYGHYWCFRSKSMIDTTMVNGYAIEDCKNFIRIAELETFKNKPTLITAYGYMAGYSANILKDLPKALSYLKRILEIDPSNLDTQKNAKILEKAIKRL